MIIEDSIDVIEPSSRPNHFSPKVSPLCKIPRKLSKVEEKRISKFCAKWIQYKLNFSKFLWNFTGSRSKNPSTLSQMDSSKKPKIPFLLPDWTVFLASPWELLTVLCCWDPFALLNFHVAFMQWYISKIEFVHIYKYIYIYVYLFFLFCLKEVQHSSLYFMYRLDGTQLFAFAGISLYVIENTILDWVRGSWNMHPTETFNGSSMHLWCWWEPRRSTWKPIHPRKSNRLEPFQSRSMQAGFVTIFINVLTTSLDDNLWPSIYKMWNPNLCDANSSCNLAMLVQESNWDYKRQEQCISASDSIVSSG